MNTNTITTETNFEFGNKNLIIRFNDAEDAKIHVVGSESPWRSLPYARAITAFMLGYYPMIDRGVYLKYASFGELAEELEVANAGYCTAEGLARLVAEKVVTYTLEDIKPDGVYRLEWTGFNVIAHHVRYVAYKQGENDRTMHDRKACQLIQTMEKLARAKARGINVRLLYSEKTTGYFEGDNGLQNKIQLWKDGDTEALNELVNTQITKSKVVRTIRRVEHQAEKAEEGFVAVMGSWELRDSDNEPVDLSTLDGRTIFLKVGSTIMKNNPLVVSTENTETIKAAARQLKATIFVSEAS